LKYDCVVIGSGVSGLASAVILARHGRKVALVEREDRIGPLLRRRERGGVWCDGGFHYIGGLCPQGGFAGLLRYLGILDHLELLEMHPDGFDVIRFPGRPALRIPIGLDRVREALCERFPESRDAAGAYIGRLERIYRTTPFSSLEVNVGEFARGEAFHENLAAFLREAGAREEFIGALDRYGHGLHGARAHEASLHAHTMVVGSYYFGAHMVRGGGESLIRAFKKRLREESVDVFCGRPAVGFRVGDRRRLLGVEVADPAGRDRETLECDVCVSTIDPNLLARILPRESIRPAFFRRVERLEETFSPFVIHLDAPSVPPALHRSNHYRFDLHDDSFDSLVVMAADPSADDSGRRSLCLIRKAWDNDGDRCGTCAGPGRRLCEDSAAAERDAEEVMRPACEAFKEQATEEALERMEEMFPELKGRYRRVATLSGCRRERYLGTWQGSIYGCKQSAGDASLGPLGPLRGLYIAGQSVNAPGVMGAIISAFLAAMQIVDRQTLWSEVQACR